MNSRYLACAILVLGLLSFGTACKGGGDGGGVFITVLETSPVDGRMDTQVETRIGFRIDAPIDADSLTNDTFFVTDAEGTRIEGALAIGDEPDTAVLTPDEPLAVLTDFTATLTTGLSATGGATLEEDFEWDFRTVDSAWGESEWLEQVGTASSSQQDIVVDGQSNALAVWVYGEQTQSAPKGRIWANRYTRVELWGTPEPIDDGEDLAARPSLAADEAGNGFAAWEQGASSADIRIRTNRYVVDQGWGTAELLQDGEVTAAKAPSVAADPDGNAIAVWVQEDMVTREQSVWARRFSAGTEVWGLAAPIDQQPPPTTITGSTTQLGMDAHGNAIAIWTRPTEFSGGAEIWSNRYTASSGEWGTAGLIKTDRMTGATGLQLDVGANGDAFVTWVQKDETVVPPRQDIWSVRFSESMSTWGTPGRIDTHDGNTIEPDIAVDGNGIAHAVWSQSDTDFQNVYTCQYTPPPGSGWGTPVLIEPANEDPNDDSDAVTPRVEVNTDGNTFVVWQQRYDGWRSIWSNHRDPENAWDATTSEVIEDLQRTAKQPIVVVDENRHAHAVWLHFFDADLDWVRTNRFE